MFIDLESHWEYCLRERDKTGEFLWIFLQLNIYWEIEITIKKETWKETWWKIMRNVTIFKF